MSFLFIKRLQADAQLPIRAYGKSAAFDISAYLKSPGGTPFTATVPPNGIKTIGTGLAVKPPDDHCVLACSRSGFAERGVFVANAPGIVDPDYTGEIRIILFNGGIEPFFIKHGDRIAQLLIVPFAAPSVVEIEGLPETPRGERGFGSTGA